MRWPLRLALPTASTSPPLAYVSFLLTSHLREDAHSSVSMRCRSGQNYSVRDLLVGLLSIVFCSHVRVPSWEAHSWVFRRLSLTIMRGVAGQLAGR